MNWREMLPSTRALLAAPSLPICLRLLLALAATSPRAAAAQGTLRTDTVWSQALGARKPLLVWLPPSYGRDAARRYPVAYYLHGLWGSETQWVRLAGLDTTLDSLTRTGLPEMIVVLPDGDDSWYTTWSTPVDTAACRRDSTSARGVWAEARSEPAASYCVPRPRYDQYIARDVVAHVDSAYRTRADRAHRAIAGGSMGGYGAVALGLRYPEVFAAAASVAGVLAPLYVGPRPFAGDARWAAAPDSLRAFYGAVYPSMRQAFGDDSASWWRHDPVRGAARARPGTPLPALFVAIGVDDPYADQSRAFRDAARRLGATVTYAEGPGTHSWEYLRAHLPESLAWIAARIAAPPAASRSHP